MIAPKDRPQPDKNALVRARVTALALGLLTIISLLLLVYAFIQKAEAEKNMQEALAQKQLYDQCQQENQKAMQAAQESLMIAKAERARAEEVLLECEKTKSNRK
ncbi:MAG: hypothetical protein KF725_01925 [Cyclobacteriaceae bacterium]|nr:hypothetical protein [Cyclobacteriaceae bacterium]UYN86798.1 MAG: hypothetical protein KIT51_00480 [Cyclobacteriaceae bacterium]